MSKYYKKCECGLQFTDKGKYDFHAIKHAKDYLAHLKHCLGYENGCKGCIRAYTLGIYYPPRQIQQQLFKQY